MLDCSAQSLSADLLPTSITPRAQLNFVWDDQFGPPTEKQRRQLAEARGLLSALYHHDRVVQAELMRCPEGRPCQTAASTGSDLEAVDAQLLWLHAADQESPL